MKKESNRDKVIRILKQFEEGLTITAIAKEANLARNTVKVILAELKGAEEYGPAWNVVVEWMKENNVEIDMSRPSYEIYLNNPEEHPEKHHIIDICMSVK